VSATPDHTHSLRLSFAYHGGDIRLARTERVAMIAPGGTTPPEGDQAGYWIEVRDTDGNRLYYRPLHNPMRRDAEVFGDAPGEPMYQHDASESDGEFDVLVPDLPHAAELLLYGPPPDADSAVAASRELVTHTFDQVRPADGGEARA
jgi:hypothetical protein